MAFVGVSRGVKNDINVTPLVDVVLVLLIIFMVVMPLAEKDLAVRIPASEQVETSSALPPDQILVRVDRAGGFSINSEPTPPDRYVEALKGRLDPRAAAERTVFVSAEDDAAYKKLVEALEGARRAGATTLGLSDEAPPAAAAAAPPAPGPAPAPAPGSAAPAPVAPAATP
jgi:biopolymer transport protein TolR